MHLEVYSNLINYSPAIGRKVVLTNRETIGSINGKEGDAVQGEVEIKIHARDLGHSAPRDRHRAFE